MYCVYIQLLAVMLIVKVFITLIGLHVLSMEALDQLIISHACTSIFPVNNHYNGDINRNYS